MNTESEESIQNPIEIVEFEDRHAESLADMWNDSKEEWGGQDGNRTAAQVKTAIRNEGNIKDFIALEGTTVVGYCGFKEYEDDEGASYIPLLNVRPSYHGKKIGKKLLLKAIEVAVEQKWPRMDLYTWSSNLKAVPLYKKCGFFWEKDNPYIHLMNFMPTVLNTEAIKAYFQDLDWYDDVARDLLVEPDGRVEKGFHFYEYLWKNEKETLKVEFCRRGRGLRLIDSKDYKVVCYTDQNEFAFGKSYPVYYRVINKTRRPLSLQLKGRDDKNIRFSMKEDRVVEKEEIIEASFYVDEIKELYHNELTHPTITTEIAINGKKAEFRLGVVPKFPLDLNLKIPLRESFVGKREKGFIDVENGFDEVVTVKFSLPHSPQVQWEEKEIELRLQGKEKKSLPLYFQVKKTGFYQKLTEIQIALPQETMSFEKELKGFIRGRRGKFYGATEKGWSVVNGTYKLTLGKYENHIKIENLEKPGRDEIGYPKLGMPFGTDFSNKLPREVSYEIEEDLIRLRVVFESKEFAGIKLHSLSELFSDGMVRQCYEVENTGEEGTLRDLWVSTALWHKFPNATFSYEGEILQLEGMEESRLVYYDVARFTENWSYAQVGENSWGIVWPKGITPEQEGPFLKINENLGEIPKGQRRSTKPVFMLYNTMKNWQELRRFALQGEDCNELSSKIPAKTLDLSLNGKNPFVRDCLALHLLERKATNLSGRITLTSPKGVLEPLDKTYKEEEDLREDTIEIDLSKKRGKEEVPGLQSSMGQEQREKVVMDTLEITADLKKTKRVYHRQIFLQGQAPIEKVRKPSILQKEDHRTGQVMTDGNIYELSNGVLTFSADPDYSNGLCSLTMGNKEVLDTSYPKYESKFPWNPWAGGMYTVPEDYELETMLKQKRRGEFVAKVDSKGNQWEGIKVITDIKSIQRYNGLEIHQYFLTLAGLPVLSTYFEIHQKTGKYLEDLTLENMMFFRLDRELSNTYFAKTKESGEKVEFKAGKYLVAHNAREKILEVGSRTTAQKVLIYAPKSEHLVGFTNKDMLVVSAYEKTFGENQSIKATDPTFLIFTEDSLMTEALEDLKTIEF